MRVALVTVKVGPGYALTDDVIPAFLAHLHHACTTHQQPEASQYLNTAHP